MVEVRKTVNTKCSSPPSEPFKSVIRDVICKVMTWLGIKFFGGFCEHADTPQDLKCTEFLVNSVIMKNL
jgi:hypothetical protein